MNEIQRISSLPARLCKRASEFNPRDKESTPGTTYSLLKEAANEIKRLRALITEGDRRLNAAGRALLK